MGVWVAHGRPVDHFYYASLKEVKFQAMTIGAFRSRLKGIRYGGRVSIPPQATKLISPSS
jgi:hypothetical protein